MRGFLGRLAGRAAPPPPPRAEPRLEARSTPLGWAGDGWGAVTSGGSRLPVGVHLAENLSALVAVVELIAGAVSSLPPRLEVDTPDGRQPAPDAAPAWRVLERPNPRQSWPAFATSLVSSLLLHGNGVAMIGSDGRGAVSSLTPIPWPWLAPVIVRGGGGARLAFDVVQAVPEAALLGLPAGGRLLDADVLHVRGRSDNGVIGRSVLSRAAGVVHEGLEIGDLARSNWGRGMRPSGTINAPHVLSTPQREQARVLLQDFQGAQAAGKVMLLEGGWTYAPLGMNAQDMEFLASRAFSVAEIARLFSVPEILIQLGPRLPADMAPFTTLFAQTCLSPIVAAVEAEFSKAVLPRGMWLNLDLAGLLRGSFSALVAGCCASVQSGVMSANDARRAIGLPALDGGDALRTGPAPTWPADRPGMAHLGPSPGATGDGLPEPGTNANEGRA